MLITDFAIRAKLAEAAENFDLIRAVDYIKQSNDALKVFKRPDLEKRLKEEIKSQIEKAIEHYTSKDWGPVYAANFKSRFYFNLTVLISRSTNAIWSKFTLNCDKF